MITDNFDYTKTSVSYPDKKDYILVSCMTEDGDVEFMGMSRTMLEGSGGMLESVAYRLITEAYRKVVSRNGPVSKYVEGYIFLLKPDHEGYLEHLNARREEEVSLESKFFNDLREEYEPISEELHCTVYAEACKDMGRDDYHEKELKYEELLDFAESVLNLKETLNEMS